jgi:THO complex subunit 4
VAPA